MRYLFYLCLLILVSITPSIAHELNSQTRYTWNKTCINFDIPEGIYRNENLTISLKQLFDGRLILLLFINKYPDRAPLHLVQQKSCTNDSTNTRPGFVFFSYESSYNIYFYINDLSLLRMLVIGDNQVVTNRYYYLSEN